MKSLDEICRPVAGELQETRRRLRERLTESPAFAAVGEYLSERRGKLIRSSLVLLAGRLFRGGTEGVSLAAACELVHLATLLHDDVLDHARTRRGQDSVNQRFGEGMAILTGDFLYCQAFSLLPARRRDRVMQELLVATRAMCEGQVLEMQAAGRYDTPLAGYLRIIQGKTAAFFERCCRAGAILAGADGDAVDALGEFGLHFGLAFQLTDDLLDLESDGRELGKPVLQDLQEGHFTAAVLHALADPREGPDLRRLLGEGRIVEEHAAIRQIIDRTGGFDHAWTLVAAEGRQALAALERLQGIDPALLDSLREMVAFVIARQH